MKTKNINDLYDLEELFREKVKVLEKVHKACNSMSYHAEKYFYIKRSVRNYMDYIAQLDKRIGEEEKIRFRR